MMTINCICNKNYHVENANIVECPYCHHVWRLLCPQCTPEFCLCKSYNPNASKDVKLGIKIEDYEKTKRIL